jgi:hypothetical protein
VSAATQAIAISALVVVRRSLQGFRDEDHFSLLRLKVDRILGFLALYNYALHRGCILETLLPSDLPHY